VGFRTPNATAQTATRAAAQLFRELVSARDPETKNIGQRGRPAQRPCTLTMVCWFCQLMRSVSCGTNFSLFQTTAHTQQSSPTPSALSSRFCCDWHGWTEIACMHSHMRCITFYPPPQAPIPSASKNASRCVAFRGDALMLIAAYYKVVLP